MVVTTSWSLIAHINVNIVLVFEINITRFLPRPRVIEKEEPDNVYKYFIYLTNNGR